MNFPVHPMVPSPQGRNASVGQNVRMAKLATEAPRIPWDEFVKNEFRWEQGEHVGLIGPTGQGKTTLLKHLLPIHPYVTVFATKPRDESMNRLVHEGYEPIKRWMKLDPNKFPRRVLWPEANTLGAHVHQKEVFHDAFERIYREGGWTVAVDELWFICVVLGLTLDIKIYLQQARALGISLLVATQRPAWVPLEVYDMSTHLFFWRDNDKTNLDRLSGISFRSADLIRSVIMDLDAHQVLYVNTRTGRMLRTRSPI